jgi:hypothetical protein
MAYTIVKSDGTVLTTIADGTINTTSTSQGLPGRNYAGYGATLDTNIVHQLENFAYTSPPANPIRGQLWYNTNANALCVCPADGTTNPASWLTLAQSGSSGTTTFGAVTVTGDLQANNVIATNNVSGANGTFTNLSVTAVATIATANVTTLNVGTANTRIITTGAAGTTGAMTGTWTVTGTGNAFTVAGGNLSTVGIRTDNYLYANGDPVSFAGTYNDANVGAYLPTYTGTVGAASGVVIFRGGNLTAGGTANVGAITGNWTLTAGSKFNATYADLAERFAADAEYEAGTVVEIGGSAEITAVKNVLSENVLGVISTNAAYLMNAAAGDDNTHPAVAIGGRVPVKVFGLVRKGDRLVSAGDGVARAASEGEATAFNTIGRSLVDKFTPDLGTVVAIVTIKG